MNRLARTTTRAFAAIAMALALTAVGCGDGMVTVDPATQEPTFQAAIKDGTVTESYKSIVGLSIQKSQYRRGICSGTLIAPNLVLTAEHCVAELASRRAICGRTNFGSVYPAGNITVTTDKDLNNANGRKFGVAEVIVPGGSTALCGRDIALLRLQKNVPSSVTRPIPPRVESPVNGRTNYTAIGYGLDGQDGRSGIRRVLENRNVVQRRARTVRYAADGQTARKTVYEIFGDDGGCSGDSGGGAIDEQGRVIGALSRGHAVRSRCLNSVYTSVYSWRDWIKSVAVDAAQAGGYPTPSWAGGTGNSGGQNDGSNGGDGSDSGADSGNDGSNGGNGSTGPNGKNLSCKAVYNCINNCARGDQQCINDCYFAGTRQARQSYVDVSTCYSNKCAGSRDPNCIDKKCGQLKQACLNPNAGNNGGNQNAGPQSCRDIEQCKTDCARGDKSCYRQCFSEAPTDAQREYSKLVHCFYNQCSQAGDAKSCLQRRCAYEYNRCFYNG